ncbi:MAG: hypothetical protein LBR12_03245, partial [Opitutaceae bacterium]|nr:hypothetical protein [Opitutaceae bacterium]
MSASQNTLPTAAKTLVIFQATGIGDLLWLTPYLHRIAAGSRDGKVSLLANPTTRARDLFAADATVAEVIDFTGRRRRDDPKQLHNTLRGLLRLAGELKQRRFDRVFVFGGRANLAFLTFAAGIKQRHGYGFHWVQRLFLNRRPFIKNRRGVSYENATAFAIALGLCDAPQIPKLSIPASLVEKMRARFAAARRPLYALGIGASAPEKQWAPANFRLLTERLLQRNCGILLAGG